MNNRRRQVLKLIDKLGTEAVSNEVKGMYGLTSYYSKVENECNQRLYEQVLKINNERRKIKSEVDEDRYFMPEQKRVLEELLDEDKKKIIFQAPTSFGKSLLIKEYIYIKKPEKVVYIVPTNSLAYELERSYKKLFAESNEYEVFDAIKSDTQLESKSEIFIGTQEKFFEISSKFDEIDLFVIDEAYKLEEKLRDNRGYILSKSLIEIAHNISKKTVLLCPPANLIGLEQMEYYNIHSSFNGVDIEVYNHFEGNALVTVRRMEREKTILYVNSPEEVLKSVEGYLQTSSQINEYSSYLMKQIKDEYTEEYSVYKALECGVLIHHGKMPKFIQNKMINLYNNDLHYNKIFATKSISEGINTPTRNIVFHENVNFKKNKMLIKNTIGRAGRLGKYPMGKVYVNEKQLKSLNEILNGNIEIKLAIAEEGGIEEISKDRQIECIREGLSSIEDMLTTEILEELAKQISLPPNKINNFFDMLKYDFAHERFNNGQLKYDNIVIKASDLVNYNKFRTYNYFWYPQFLNLLLTKSKKQGSSYIPMNSDKARIKYLLDVSIKKANGDVSKTKVIDEFISFKYTVLEYEIMPMINFYFMLKDLNISIDNNEIIDNVFRRVKNDYMDNVLQLRGIPNVTDDEKRVIHRLNEYGISLSDVNLNIVMIKEIVSSLKTRYSMYDIIKTIENLSNTSKFANLYKNLLKKYF